MNNMKRKKQKTLVGAITNKDNMKHNAVVILKYSKQQVHIQDIMSVRQVTFLN